jgi:ubiquinone/menaquinone biosynthesis C-methylase UbiE
MSTTIEMGAHLAASAVRLGWFYGVNQMMDRQAQRLGQQPRYKPRRPVPTRAELMRVLGALLLDDARNVRRGLYPAVELEPARMPDFISRVRAMMADLPAAIDRRETARADSVREEAPADDLPAYYLQDFHFQSGGYLSEQSARLYDVQVETLFYGSADAMRRAALPAIAREIAGRDQRRMTLLDVACGTGRFLREVRLAWPALRLTGLDLSSSYLREGLRHMGELRPATWLEANAEAIPLPDASQDIVTCIYLFHELPDDVRRRVATEMARVLKPGGLLVFVDSLQMGDRPGWDGLLEAFPVRFHEPYFRGYAIEDLEQMFNESGLAVEATSLAFLSKVIACRAAG